VARARRRAAAADQRPVTAWPTADGRVKLSAAALIERAGVPRGHPGPDAGMRVSTRHTLALTHRGGGTTAELLALARQRAEQVNPKLNAIVRPLTQVADERANELAGDLETIRSTLVKRALEKHAS